MKSTITSLLMIFALSWMQAQHTVTVADFSFTPTALTINAGETVTWNNTQGHHNVNGSQASYPNNPEDFFSGMPAMAPWSFSYTFTTPGVYEYRCDEHPIMVGTITVVNPEPALVLTALFDGPLTGGIPKGFELFALDDIPNLSIYGLGSANNGQGSDGVEYSFPAVAVNAGDFIYVANDSAGFNQFFGFNADFVDGGNATNINGDDAVEVFLNGEVIDVFGDINVDGTGQPWEYLDGWAYRVSGTGPDGSTFVLGSWYFSGIDAMDNETTNGTAATPVPIGTYTLMMPEFVSAADDNAFTQPNQSVTISVLTNDLVPGDITAFALVNNPANGIATVNAANHTITYTPEQDYCGDDSFTYRICNANGCDTAAVHVTIECPSNYPAYTINQVRSVNAEGVADSLHAICQLQGVVYGYDLRGGAGVQFTIIDNTGGIGVFSASLDTYTVAEGDQVIVRGMIDQFSGLIQIQAEEIILVSSGNALQSPTIVTSLDENTESDLIKIENATIVNPTQWTNSGAGFNVDITDGNNIYSMRIDNDVNIFGTTPPTEPFHVTGIGSQFDNSSPYTEGYQIIPRYTQDIALVTSLQEPQWLEGLKVYPNPTSSVLHIAMKGKVDQVTLLTAYGSELKQWSAPQHSLAIDLAAYPSGVYWLKFNRGGEQWSTRVVKY